MQTNVTIHFWLKDVAIVCKDNQTFIPKMGDRVLLDYPKPGRYLVVSREFVYVGEEVRVDITILPSPKFVVEKLE